MTARGISFFYEEEKVKILKDAAEDDDRTTSSYLQIVLDEHIKETEGQTGVMIAPTTIVPKKKLIKKRRIKKNGKN